jgi:hypothetical protein
VTVESAAFLISVSWLSETGLKIKNIVGDDLWRRIVHTVGGSTLYIPLECNYYDRRNREIRLFARDHTVGETAHRFCLSRRQTKRILRR